MKRPIFFIISAVLVLVLLIAWVYVLFFSQTPTSDDSAFVNFPGNNSGEVGIQDPAQTDPVTDIRSNDRLRQLTLDPVIGFTEVRTTPNSTPLVYYVTAGRGQVFSINLFSGEEERISGTTIASARYSAITPNGAYVLTQAGRGSGSEFFVSPLNTGADNAPLTLIQEDIISFHATVDNTFLYAAKAGNGLVAKEYFPASSTSATLFSIPFQEAVIQWGDSALDTHLVYPKATTQLEGYLYVSQAGEPLARAMPGGFGFSATGNTANVLYSIQNRGVYTSSVYNLFTKEITLLPISVIPQKCARIAILNRMLCAANAGTHSGRTPDDWHEGSASFADTIFEVNLRTGSMAVLSNTLDESGRAIDIINPTIGSQDVVLYFQNKNDQTLWLFAP